MDMDTLYAAAIAGDADAIAKLDIEADVLNDDGETILHTESRNGNTERVQLITRELERKNLVAKLSEYKHTALHLATFYGWTEVAEVLIDAARRYLPVNSFQDFLRQGDEDMNTALHTAVIFNRVDIVKLLVEADPTDTHSQYEGKTPLYIAVEKGYNKIVEIISTTCTAPSLDGPDDITALRIKNHEQDALYVAAIAGDAVAIAKLEMQADTLNEDGQTILHIESGNGNTERVRFILKEFANKNLLVKPSEDEHTALHLAIYIGHTEVAEVLIDEARHLPSPSSDNDNPVTSFQAFLRHADQDMNTALHVAVMLKHVALVKLLVEADPTDRHTQNDEGKTPMYIAVEKGFNQIVEIISTTCTAPSLDGPDGSTAVPIKNPDQVKRPGGILYKIMDRDALFASATAGDAQAIAKLETETNILNEQGETILQSECRKGNTERVRFLLREFANKNLLVKLGNQQETALTWAAHYGQTEVAEVLIDAARHLLPSSSTNDSPITSFQAFLRHADQDMDTALHVAVTKGEVAIAKLLVEADPSARDIQNRKGKTPIYIAAEKGYTDIVKVICTTGTAPLNLDGPGGTTALHAVIKNRNHGTEVVEVLIGAARLSFSAPGSPVSSFQAFLRRGDHNLNTALHIAVMQGNLASSKLLVESDPSYRHNRNSQGKTPLYIAAERGYADIVKMMCKTCTVPFDLVGPRGRMTTLHVVITNLSKAEEEVSDVLKMIIDGVKCTFMSKNVVLDEYKIQNFFAETGLFYETEEYGRTALELAVERNYVKVVQLILDLQSPAYQDYWISDDFIGLMPLIYKAKDWGCRNMVKLLTERYEAGAGLSIHLKNQVCLISAIAGRKKESVISLLDEHAQRLVTFADHLGWTALHHAAYHEFDQIIYAIIEAKKTLGHQFVYRMPLTPFHVAAGKGFTSTLMLLMQLWPSWSSAYTAVDIFGNNILHIAALQSNKEMIQGILKCCSNKYKNVLVNQQNKIGNTALHLLISRGCLIPELLRYQGLNIRIENEEKLTAPDMLYSADQIINQQVQIKIALDHMQIDQKRDIFSSSVLSSKRDRKDLILNKQAKLMMHEKYARMKEGSHAIANCFAEAIAGDAISKAALEMEVDALNEEGKTILHVESMKGDTERVQYIVTEFASKNLLVKPDRLKQTALHLAAQHGHTQVVEVLIDAAKHLSSSSADNDTHDPVSSLQDFIRQANSLTGNTALHLAVLSGNLESVKLLVDADPNDSHVQNNEGKTPIYIAAENGYKDIVKEMCTTCTALSIDGPGGSTTALHALIQNIGQEKEEGDVIRMMINAAKGWSPKEAISEALSTRINESGHTFLELAVHRNCVEVVELIFVEDRAYDRGSKNKGFMRLIYTAIDKEYKDILKLLTETYEAQVSVVHKGVTDLIVAIRKRDRVCVVRLLEENKQLVTFVDDDGWTPLHQAADLEFDSILGPIIEAQKDVGHQFVYKDKHVSTPFHLAAKKGYTFTLILLLELWPSWSSAYTDVDNDGRNILHLAAFESEKEMIQGILKYCPEKYKNQFVNKQDSNGDTPLHLLIKRGCFIPELMKYKGLDTMIKNKSDQTPLDSFYLEDGIIADQVKIKMALDDIETDQRWKFWRKNIKMRSNYLESVVLPSRRKAKDVQFENAKKKLIDEKHGQMTKDLERYKKRTNTQIIVTALITTVTFTVGFTMPGGLHQSGELDQGLVLLSRKTAFNAFMVSDALALLLSTCSLFLYFLESMYEDLHQVSKLNAASTGLNIVSVVAMMLTFITGTHVVLSHSLALAITVCIIGSFFFLFVIVLLIKIFYDRQVKRDED